MVPGPGPAPEVSPSHGAGWTLQVARFWDLLTAPSPRVTRPEARRRARTLAGILLFLLIAAALLTFVMPWLVAPEEHDANRTLSLTGFSSVAFGLAIYALARTRHYEAAGTLAVLTTMGACTASIILADGSVWGRDAPYFLALSVILSSVLLPLAVTFLVIAANLLILGALAQYLPTFGDIHLSNAVAFLGFVSVLLLVTAYVRQLDLRQIHDQAHEIQLSEERYRSLFEATFEGIILHDEGRILDTNAALARMFGLPRERLLNATIQDLVVPDSRPHISHKTLTSVHETNEAIAQRPDGATFPVEFVSKPYLHQGRLVRVTAFRDITERKEADAAREKSRELAAANRRLQEIDRLKTHILNTASHELNTPITPLRLQVHLLKEGRLGSMNEKQTRAVAILHRNLARLDHLIKDMLDVSHLQSGHLDLHTERLDLNTLVSDAVDSYRDVAAAQEVILTAASDAEAWVTGDPTRLQQVLSNLLSNALKFTPPHGHVHVTTRIDGDHALVSVQDDGLGLNAEQRAQLFQPFGQVHGHIHRTERGSGLGLYICKGIVERHGGRILVASPGPGRGSTFSFSVPVAA